MTRRSTAAGNQRGAIFVMTLAVLAALVAVMAAAALAQRMRFIALLNRVEGQQARFAADAGIQRAMEELSTLTLGQAMTQQDTWYTLGKTGAERFVLGNASFRVQIVDVCARVDVNTVTADQLQRMPMTQEQIDSLLDWRESGTTPRPDGAKDEYYNNLQNPYNSALRNFDTLDELLCVRGFTGRSLYYPQTDVVSTATISQGTTNQQVALYDLFTTDAYSPLLTPDGQAKFNINQPNLTVSSLTQHGIQFPLAGRLIQALNSLPPPSRRFTSLGQMLNAAGGNRSDQGAILDNLTWRSTSRVEGLIDLNTASESVLNTLPNVPPDVVQAILTRQSQGFAQLSDVLDVPGMSGATLNQNIDSFTVQSSSFWVRVEGTCGSSHVYIEALVTTDNNQPKVIRVEHPPFGDMPTRWGWATQTTTDTVLGDQKQ